MKIYRQKWSFVKSVPGADPVDLPETVEAVHDAQAAEDDDDDEFEDLGPML
jgi:hypothetical protein